MTTVQPIIEEVTLTPREALADKQERLQELLEEWKQERERMKEMAIELDKAEREVKVLEQNVKKQIEGEVVKGPFEQARRGNQPISGEVRALIAKKVLEENLPYKEVAKLYEVSRSSVGRIVKEAREERKRQKDEEEGTAHSEPPRKRKKRGRKEKIDSETLLIVLGWIEDTPNIPLKEICRRLKDDTTVGKVSISTLNRKLDKVDITYKDILDIPNRWNTEEVIVRRREYVRNIFQVGFRPLVFLDECPFNINIHARKGRAVKGHTPSLTVHHKGRNITLLAAMDKNGILFYKFITSTESKAGVNADDFRLFLVSLSKHLPQNGVIILDNASIHHEAEVNDYYEELRKSSHKVDTRFLPPYSPFLNPIEYAFSKLKKEVKQETWENVKQLQQVIERKLANITSQDAAGWFAHTLRFFPQCEVGMPFRGKPLAPRIEVEAESALNLVPAYSVVPRPPLLLEAPQ